MKETWENLNRAYNSALIRRKKKTSGSSRSNDKPWKFETSMSFLKAVKQKRNTTCNLDQIDESDTDEKSSVGGLLEQAKDKSSICDVNDDGDGDDGDGDDEHSLNSLTSLKPVSLKSTSKVASSKQKATDDARADDDGSLGSSSSALKPLSQKNSSKCASTKRKTNHDTHDDARTGLYRVMAQRMEDKQKSPRLKFFESIMPQVDQLTDDCFLDFQMEVLRSLKRFRQDPDPKRISDNLPVTQTPWQTSMSNQQPCTPAPATAPALSTLYPLQGGFLQSQQTYRFPN